jgi:hypothetical protein
MKPKESKKIVTLANEAIENVRTIADMAKEIKPKPKESKKIVTLVDEAIENVSAIEKLIKKIKPLEEQVDALKGRQNELFQEIYDLERRGYIAPKTYQYLIELKITTEKSHKYAMILQEYCKARYENFDKIVAKYTDAVAETKITHDVHDRSVYEGTVNTAKKPKALFKHSYKIVAE